MKEFEYIGVMCSIVGYMMIVMGNLGLGFVIGLAGSFAFSCYFYQIRSFPTLGLQSFFICANMYGLVNLGI